MLESRGYLADEEQPGGARVVLFDRPKAFQLLRIVHEGAIDVREDNLSEIRETKPFSMAL